MNRLQMNVNEVMADMRHHGLRISPKKFNMMVDAGLLPFVRVLSISPGGRRTQVIFRKDYESWRNKEMEAIT